MGIPAIGLGNPVDLYASTSSRVTFAATYADSADSYAATSVVFEIDTDPGFASGNKITSTFSNWPSGKASLMAAILADDTWYWRVTATNVDGTVISETRSLTVAFKVKRVLYNHYNVAKYGPIWSKKRVLYNHYNVAKYGPIWSKKRALYNYENITSDPPFPYIERLSVARASQGATVTIYGNGFGSKAESDPYNADRAARGYGGAVYLGTKVCGIVSWSWQEITFTVPEEAVTGAVYVRLTTPDPEEGQPATAALPGVRDSNKKGLDIYEALPTENTGLELFIYDMANPNTMLAQVDAATDKSFMVMRNGSGSGRFRISRLDPKGSNRGLITDQNFVLCRVNGQDVFKWVIERRVPKYVEDTEEQQIEVSGRGVLSVLNQAIVYPDIMPFPTSLERSWDLVYGAAVFLDLFEEAQGRGCFPYITVDFTRSEDSLGIPWDDADLVSVTFHTGTKLLKVAEKLSAGMGIFDLEMTPTLKLRAFKGGKGEDRSATVHFMKGQALLEHENESDSTNIENVIMVEGETAAVVEVTSTTSNSAFGRREGYLQARNIPDDFTQLANYGLMRANKSGQVAWGIRVKTDFFQQRLFEGYDIGDWVWVTIEPEGSDTVGFDGKVRVVGATVMEDANGNLTAKLDLNNIMLEKELYMAQLLERLSSGSLDPVLTAPSEEPKAGVEHNHDHGNLTGLGDGAADHPDLYNELRHAADLHDFLQRVDSIKAQGQNALEGAVTLVPGSNVTLTQNNVTKEITIAASGGGSGGANYGLLPITLTTGMFTSSATLTNPGYMVDGRWHSNAEYCQVGTGLQWLKCDLGSIKKVGKIAVIPYYFDVRSYVDVKLEFSSDDVTWATVFNRTGNSLATHEGYRGEFPSGQDMRYIRYTVNGNTINAANHVCEFSVDEYIAVN